jgi:hypothetical protein
VAGTTLVKDVLWRASVLLGDHKPAQFIRWSEREMVDWLTDAQLAIIKYLPAAGSRIDSIKLKPGSRQSIEFIDPDDVKPGDGSVPFDPVYGMEVLDVIRNMGTDGQTPGAAISDAVDRRMLDAQNRNWHNAIGNRVMNIVHDPRNRQYFYVYPGVTNGWVEVSYTARPAPIPNTGTAIAPLYAYSGGSTLTIFLGSEWVEDIVNYICARAKMKQAEVNGDMQGAVAFTQLFLNSLNTAGAAMSGSNPNLKRLPLAPTPLGAAS